MFDHPWISGINPKPDEIVEVITEEGSRPAGPEDYGKPETLPDYLNELNAMHEAEKTLTKEQCNQFNSLLMDTKLPRKEMTSESEKWSWHATAAQRAEAFLRTIGKWEESK